ncbi:hypothetical protein LRX75_04605 [Rhizobium sp. DKSPLA3]|uniref:N-acetyltransferase domain-containing protein n=1 Tax=Rhizobium quercicola TaxID=2901226 RepID=A0A9X1NQ42_9HYPH|nr:GNAT family N-acetyltransferase [Rhizobium quercicola]MCD7108323.1 hypothetical protein [Rhizobium quercicola]
MPRPDIFLPDDIWRIRPAETSDRVLLRTLLDAYLHGLSAFGPVDAVYLYFGAADRWAYLVEVRSEGIWRPQGFALVNRHSCSGLVVDRAMAEFCVLPAFRRTGVGKRMARRLLTLHAGIWELGVSRHNAAAWSFWRSVTATFDGVAVIDADDTRILRFDSRQASRRILSGEG